MTRKELLQSLETEKDPIGATLAYIRNEMSGLVRHDLDAKNNGWDPFEYPESGYIWHEAEGILLEAAGVEDLDDIEGIYDDTYADLVDAIGTMLEGDEDMAISALVEAWETMVDDGEMDEIEMAQSLIEQVEGTRQGWDMSAEDAECHPEIAAMIGLQIDPYTHHEPTDEEMAEADMLWEAWGRVVGEAARRWLADHPEARKAAYAEAGAVDPDEEEE